jgi:hypothetical protein
MRFAWNLGAVQFSEYDADGFIGVQLDPQGADGGAAHHELAHPYGFASRPLDPDPNGIGCTVLVGYAGGRDSFALVLSDPRLADKLPPLEKGSSVQYGATGTFGVIDGTTGTWTLYAPAEFDGSGTPTKSHLVQVGVDTNGKPTVSITHSEGMSLVAFNERWVISNAAGDAYIELGPDGIVLNGNLKIVGGVDIGGTGALPLTLQPALATALAQFAAAVAAAVPVPADGGAAVLAVLKAATAALSGAAAGMATTVSKGK